MKDFYLQEQQKFLQALRKSFFDDYFLKQSIAYWKIIDENKMKEKITQRRLVGFFFVAYT